ncbi:unnamed protein product, partial [marine sediment metagenome]
MVTHKIAGPTKTSAAMAIRIAGTAIARSSGSSLKMPIISGAKISSTTKAIPMHTARPPEANLTAPHNRSQRRAPKLKPTMGKSPAETPNIGIRARSAIRMTRPPAAMANDPNPERIELNMAKTALSVISIII